MKLIDIGLKLLAVAGLGMASFVNSSTPFSNGGAYYQRSIPQPRQFMLAGQLDFTNLSDLQRARQKLIDLVNPQRLPSQQPLIVRYHRTDPCTGEETETIDIPCVYESGLEGSIDNFYTQRLGLVFRQFMPAIYADGEQGSELTTSVSISDANYAVKRIDGVWSNISSSLNGPVYAFARARDGGVYVGGSFTNIGDANGDCILKINTDGTFSSLGTGANGAVVDMAVAPNGDLYAVGSFTLMGGVANTIGIARWNGFVWSALGAGIDTTVNSIAIGNDGIIYIGGGFTDIGDANGDYITSWNGASYVSLGTGMDLGVAVLKIGPDGDLYVGGNFSTAGGVSANRIAKWDGSVWSALDSGMSSGGFPTVEAIEFDDYGNLYAGGTFTTAGGVSASNIAVWNGVEWSSLGSGVNGTVWAIAYSQGLLNVAGAFTLAGGIDVDMLSIWNGTSWTPYPIEMPGATAAILAIEIFNNDLYMGYDGTGIAIAEILDTVFSSGNGQSYPVFKFTGPGVIRTAKNATTGETFFFNDLYIVAGETVTLNLDPLNFSFVSSFHGSVIGSILSGSNSTIRIMPGSDRVSIFMTDTTVDSGATIRWRPAYHGLDGAVP